MSAPARACESASSASNFERGIVGHFAIFDHAAMPMAGVLAEANVGDDDQIEFGLANGFDGALHDAGGRRGFRAGFVLVFRDAKEDHSGNAEPFDFAALLHQLVRRLLIDAGHGADLHAHALAGANEHGVDIAAGGEARFARQAAHRFGAAQTSRTLRWKCHGSVPFSPLTRIRP